MSGLPSGAVAGLLWMVATSGCYALAYTGMRILSADISIYEITFLRALVGCAFLGPWILIRRPQAIRMTRWRLYTVRSCATYGAMTAMVYGIANVPIADVTSLNLTTPLITVLLAATFLGERVGIGRWVALVVGCAGALLIIRPGFETVTFASVAGLFAALGYGIANASTKALTRTDHPDTVAFWMYGLIVPLSLPAAVWHWTTPSWSDVPLILFLGFVTILSQFCMSRSLASADTSVVLPAYYLQMPFAAGCALLMFGEVPATLVWVGAAIISGSAYYTALRERRAERKH